MRNNIISSITLCLLSISCTHLSRVQASTDLIKTDSVIKATSVSINSEKASKEDAFKKITYLKINHLISGAVFQDKAHNNVFYRILQIQEEENISLYAEKISIGDEGGNYQLIKRSRLTDDRLVLPEFGLAKVDSLMFIDSVTVSGYFNDKKQSIKLSDL